MNEVMMLDFLKRKQVESARRSGRESGTASMYYMGQAEAFQEVIDYLLEGEEYDEEEE